MSNKLKNEIGGFFHCKECLKQFIDSPYRQHIEVGWTKKGFQVWCKRHNTNIVHIDFKGQKVCKVI